MIIYKSEWTNNYPLTGVRLFRFNPIYKTFTLDKLNKERLYKTMGQLDSLVESFYPSYHTIKHDLEQLWIEYKAEVFEF